MLLAPVVHGDGVASPDVRSVFLVAKSENRNQVHYGVRLDAGCAPVGKEPAFAYWRMLERGPATIEPLLGIEQPAYGFAENRLVARTEHGGRVRVKLAALPSRPIVIDVWEGENGCAATASTTIGGVPASLTSVFVKLRWLFGVDHLVVSGRASDDGRVVCETVKP